MKQELGEGWASAARERGFTRSVLPRMARRMLEQEMAQRAPVERPKTVFQVFERVQHLYVRPDHLLPLVHEFDAAASGERELRTVVHAPPQHGKTTTCFAAFIAAHYSRPGLEHAYITYSITRAEHVKHQFIDFCRQVGVPVSHRGDRVTLGEPTVRRGGTAVKFTGVDGPVTGFTISGICVIDDPIKNYDDARSPTMRERAWNAVNKTLLTRNKAHMSVIASMTRWHPDDVCGRLINKRWKHIRLPALADAADDPLGRSLNEPLWPERALADGRTIGKPATLYDEAQSDPLTWAAMWQGIPSSEGTQAFNEPLRYRNLPTVYRVYYGIDLADRGADWSVCVRLYWDPSAKVAYVVDVLRSQLPVLKFEPLLRAFVSQEPGPITFLTGGQERPMAELMKLPRLSAIPATKSKYTRAMPAIKAWNQGRILLPSKPSQQVKDFTNQVLLFTGHGDLHDDDVDALSSAFQPLEPGGSGVVLTADGAYPNRNVVGRNGGGTFMQAPSLSPWDGIEHPGRRVF